MNGTKATFKITKQPIPKEVREQLLNAGLAHRVVCAPNSKVLEFWKAKEKVKVLLGGNRTGKTESAVIEVVWRLLGEHPFSDELPNLHKPPVHIRWIVPDFALVEQTVRPKLLRYLSPCYLEGGSWDTAFSQRFHTLRLTNGSILDFKSHKTPLLGLEGVSLHFVVIDEECELEAFNTLLMRTLDTDGQIAITATPLKGFTWMFDLVSKKREDVFCEYLSLEDNTVLDAQAIERVKKFVSDKRRLEGVFDDVRVFPFFSRQQAVQPSANTPPPNGAFANTPPTVPVFVGFDWGFKHPSVAVVGTVDEKSGDVVIIDVLEWRQQPLRTVVEELKQKYPFVQCVFYDSQLNAHSTDGLPQGLPLFQAFPTIPATKNINYTIDICNSLFKEGRIHFKENGVVEDLCNRISTFAYKDPNSKNELPRINDDHIDSFRYLIWGLFVYGYAFSGSNLTTDLPETDSKDEFLEPLIDHEPTPPDDAIVEAIEKEKRRRLFKKAKWRR